MLYYFLLNGNVPKDPEWASSPQQGGTPRAQGDPSGKDREPNDGEGIRTSIILFKSFYPDMSGPDLNQLKAKFLFNPIEVWFPSHSAEFIYTV